MGAAFQQVTLLLERLCQTQEVSVNTVATWGNLCILLRGNNGGDKRGVPLPLAQVSDLKRSLVSVTLHTSTLGPQGEGFGGVGSAVTPLQRL